MPDIDSKFYAATQVIDEARHVEVYSRYLHEKLELVYPLNPNLRSLLDDVISDSPLGHDVPRHAGADRGAGPRRLRADPQPGAPSRSGKAINAYVMQDEARHVMFGRLALRDYYPQLTEAERDEREEFCVDACYRMRDRFLGEEVWRDARPAADEVIEYVDTSELAAHVPRLPVHAHRADPARHRPVGPARSRRRSPTWACSRFADTDIDAAMAEDERAAEEFDARFAHVQDVANVA